MRKRTDVQIDVVIKEPDPTAQDGATVKKRQKSETKARRNIIFARDVVAVEPHTVIDGQPPIHGPLVLEVGQKLPLIAVKLAPPNKVELLAACAVGSQNAHRGAGITAIKSNVVHSGAALHNVFAGKFRWREAVDFQHLVLLTLARLLIEKVSRIQVRGKIHRRRTGTGEDVGIELLEAERRFQHGAAI